MQIDDFRILNREISILFIKLLTRCLLNILKCCDYFCTLSVTDLPPCGPGLKLSGVQTPRENQSLYFKIFYKTPCARSLLLKKNL